MKFRGLYIPILPGSACRQMDGKIKRRDLLFNRLRELRPWEALNHVLNSHSLRRVPGPLSKKGGTTQKGKGFYCRQIDLTPIPAEHWPEDPFFGGRKLGTRRDLAAIRNFRPCDRKIETRTIVKREQKSRRRRSGEGGVGSTDIMYASRYRRRSCNVLV